MNPKISRRTFLKGGAVVACATAAAATPVKALAAGKTQLATLHDLRKCIGCGECVEACREANADKFPEPSKPFPSMVPKRVKAEDWSDLRDVNDRLTPYNWLYIQEASVETEDGEEVTLYMPRRCMHCVNPPCAKLCPWGAANQTAEGIALIDASICMGGAKCRSVCPWDIPQRQTGVGLYLDLMPSYAGNGVMYKCDRCYDRIQNGETPACIEACPEDVQTIGPRDEIIITAYAIADEIGGYVYGDKENGGTNTIYVSPVPFDQLDEAIEKGKGQPDFAPKKDAMATGNNIAKSMFIAPFAGIFAAVARFYSLTRNDETKEADHDA